MRKKPSSIYAIAEKTGFSASTVARALRGTGYVSERTRGIILDAATELNYAPNQAAKTLKNNITRKIMFCIPDILNPYYFKMIRGVFDITEQNGYYTVLAYSQHDTEREIQIIKALKTGFVDGLILGSFDFNHRLIEEIRDSGYPTVLTNLVRTDSGDDQFDCVYVDHTKAVRLATEHLLRRGHRNICLLGGSLSEQTGAERRLGYASAMSDFGLERRDELIIQSNFTREGGYRDFSRFTDLKIHFTAIVACNDLMGVAAMYRCRELGLSVPGDVAIATLDDTDYCLCTDPNLTSIDMKQYEIGSHSADLLLKNIRGQRKTKNIVRLEPELVIREST